MNQLGDGLVFCWIKVFMSHIKLMVPGTSNLKVIIRAKNQNQIDISLGFLYNLIKMRNDNFKG